MEKQIVEVGYSEKEYWAEESWSESEEKIVAVKLNDGTIEEVKDVIDNIKNGDKYYYTLSGGKKAKVEVYKRNGAKYIRTDPDETKANNLTNLPHFIY